MTLTPTPPRNQDLSRLPIVVSSLRTCMYMTSMTVIPTPLFTATQPTQLPSTQDPRPVFKWWEWTTPSLPTVMLPTVLQPVLLTVPPSRPSWLSLSNMMTLEEKLIGSTLLLSLLSKHPWRTSMTKWSWRSHLLMAFQPLLPLSSMVSSLSSTKSTVSSFSKIFKTLSMLCVFLLCLLLLMWLN